MVDETFTLFSNLNETLHFAVTAEAPVSRRWHNEKATSKLVALKRSFEGKIGSAPI